MNKDIKKLYYLIKEYYDYKCDKILFNLDTLEVTFILYKSFYVRCGFEKRYGIFGAGIELCDGIHVHDYLGQPFSINSDEESIKKSLKLIDDYCRLRLPDKFLDAFEAAHQEYLDSLYEDIL